MYTYMYTDICIFIHISINVYYCMLNDTISVFNISCRNCFLKQLGSSNCIPRTRRRKSLAKMALMAHP